MQRLIRNNRGIALLVSISIITLLVASSIEINRKVRTAVASTAATRDRMTALHQAGSAVHVAMAMLVQDKTSSDADSVQEDWADSAVIETILQEIELPSQSLDLKISDELGKLQVNALIDFPEGRAFNEAQRQIWENYLTTLVEENDDLTDVSPPEIINSMKDWLDSGDNEAITGLSGAESDYYLDLDPPYVCSNGPFVDCGELALVRGVTPLLFRGTEQIPGLADFVTPFGMSLQDSGAVSFDGKININTADLPVLAALMPLVSRDLALSLLEYRIEKSDDQYIHDLTSPDWYKNAPGAADLKIDPKVITTKSDIFRIDATSKANDFSLTISTVVRREQAAKSRKWRCRVLSWETL